MEHTYVNHANYYNEAKEVITGGGVQEQFMVKLFKLLELADLQETNLANIMSWHSHGRFFRVHNSKKAVFLIKTSTHPFAASSIYGASSVLLKLVLTVELITIRCFLIVNLSFVAHY